MLSEDQRKRMEENRRLAMEKLAKKHRVREEMNGSDIIQTDTKGSIVVDAQASSIHPFFTQAPSVPASVPQPLSSRSRPPLRSLYLDLYDRHHFSLTDVPQLSHVYKSIIELKYIARERVYTCPIRLYSRIVALFSPHCNIEKIPDPVLELFVTGKVSKKKQVLELIETTRGPYDMSLVDEILRDALLPFQLAAVNWALDRQGRILLADDMGLGKTLSALAIACFYRKEWPLLIVVPASLVAAWEDALLRWVPSETLLDIVYANTKNLNEKAKIRVLSYEMAVKHVDELTAQKNRVMIVDESHYLKNPSTKRCHAMVPLMRSASRLILLSGTPAMSRPVELFTQASSLCPLLFSKLTEYGIRYCDGKKNAYFGGWEFKGCTHSRELQTVLEHTILLRRLKSDVLQQLPPKRREQVFLRLAPEDLLPLKGLANAILKDRISEESWSSNALYMKYYADTGKGKIKAVVEYLEDLLTKDTKMLIFAHHQEILNQLEDFLYIQKVNHIRIDGSTASQDRQQKCTTFQTDLRCRVALLSITAAGIGLTLTAADRVIFTELFWNPGILLQAEDRAHRIGQVKSYVQVTYLLAKESFDDLLWPLLLRKLNVLESVGLMKKGEFGLHEDPPITKGGLDTFYKTI